MSRLARGLARLKLPTLTVGNYNRASLSLKDSLFSLFKDARQ